MAVGSVVVGRVSLGASAATKVLELLVDLLVLDLFGMLEWELSVLEQ